MNSLFSQSYIRFVAMIVGVAIIAGALYFLALRTGGGYPVPGATSTPSAASSTADATIGQYNERPESAVRLIPAAAGNAKPTVAAAPALVAGCALQFSFTPTSKIVAPGGTITYSLVVRNGGRESCENVSLSIYYGDNEAFVSATPKPTASNYYWSIGTMAPAAEFTATVVTAHVIGGDETQISNQACATGDNAQDVCPQNIIFIGSGGSHAPASPQGTSIAMSVSKAISSIFSPPSASREYGMWVWESPLQMSAAYETTMLQTLQANKFNAVYITIDDYLDIASLPAGPGKDQRSAAYMKDLSALVVAATKEGIAVDAEGGEKDWVEEGNRWRGYALIDFVTAYNKAYPQAKLRGFQYDVEPYLLPAYDTDKAAVLEDFVAFIDASALRMKGTDAAFSVVIPHFYDAEQQWTPSITYNGVDGYAFTHLLKVLEQKRGSTLIVMAYRNHFDGDDGTQDLAQAEVKEASSGGYSTRVIVAQETGNVDPAYVTFHGMTKADLLANVGEIEAAFKPYSNYGGVAIHYLDPFLDLK